MIPCTGVILSGGENTRFGGREKAFITVGGVRILDRIYTVLSERFDEILLVTNRPELYVEWDLTIVTDLFRTRCSLAGIHAALFYASHPHIFVTASDTPFIKGALVDKILDYVDDRMDAFIPETENGLEPLCAAYAKKALPAVENNLSRNRFRIIRAFRKDRIKKIPEKVLRRYDPELIAFHNLNTPEKLAQAQAMAKMASSETKDITI
jgi:molybdenum cofactor guanylyltransferase